MPRKITPEKAEPRIVYGHGTKPPRPTRGQGGPSKTKQEFRDQLDIKSIQKRYQETGILPQFQKQNSIFGDFTQIQGFEEAQCTIAKAKSAFERLPESIRRKFGYDPTNLHSFMMDEKNREEAVKMGLIAPEEPPEAPKPPEQSSLPAEPPPSPEPPKSGKGGEG